MIDNYLIYLALCMVLCNIYNTHTHTCTHTHIYLKISIAVLEHVPEPSSASVSAGAEASYGGGEVEMKPMGHEQSEKKNIYSPQFTRSSFRFFPFSSAFPFLSLSLCLYIYICTFYFSCTNMIHCITLLCGFFFPITCRLVGDGRNQHCAYDHAASVKVSVQQHLGRWRRVEHLASARGGERH